MKAPTLEELKSKLRSLRQSNRDAWNTYGSELCVGAMLRQEEDLEKQIKDAGGTAVDLLDCYR